MDFLKLPTPEAAAAAATAKKKSNNERNKWLNRVVVYRIVEFMKFWKHARVCSRRHRDGGGWWHRAHFCRCTPATLNTWYSTFPLVVRVERVCVSSANEGKKSRSPIFWILNWFCCCCRYAFRRRPTFNLVAFFILLLSRMLSRMVIQPVACTADPNFSRYENCCRKNGTHADGTHSLILLARLYVSAGFACHLYFGERDPWLQYLKLPAIGFEILKLR